ncbi:VOC family protein [Dyadobacter sp. Leaf189]|uniref:VOC family protein n=1 Tax=Dyadobacter sp. Leaf189 TaxID=1736295 RepID=UPI000700DCCC|nr:VOC family protein [Dyadobacter sp. Leaf189]KQS30633.1 glyoxalase [Dyadobacter sp. Leaf189]
MQKTVSAFYLLFLFLLTGSVSFAQSNFTSKTIGVGVVVSDMKRSLDFYVDGIGMVKTGNFTINADFGKRSGLTNGEAVEVNILKLENAPESTDWKLMSFGKKAGHKKPEFIQDDTGMQYITINVKALNPVIDRLKKQNVKFLGSTPTALSEKAHFVLVQDPDGTFIELIGPLD